MPTYYKSGEAEVQHTRVHHKILLKVHRNCSPMSQQLMWQTEQHHSFQDGWTGQALFYWTA